MTASQPSTGRKKGGPPLWWRVIRLPLIAYLLLLLMMIWFENSLIYVPTRYPAGNWQPADLKFEDADFTAADDTRLHGWYAAADDPQAVILFCHGNAGNVTHRDDVLRTLPQYADASVLVFDYRGYGKSEGVPTEAGVLADARAARAWLAQRASVAEKEIVLMGESLGGAVAVNLAAQDGARGLILENTFTSLPDVAAHHYPWLPARWLMRGRLDALANIRRYQGPLLMLHGDADTIIPYSLGKRLFEAANEPKQFVTFRGADHNDPRAEEAYDAIRNFLRSLDDQPPSDE